MDKKAENIAISPCIYRQTQRPFVGVLFFICDFLKAVVNW